MGVHKWAKDVALLGGSYTKHGSLLTTPELKGKTFRELAAWAVEEACENAGVTVGDIDAMIVSNTIGGNMKAGITMANTLAEYLGMNGKPVIRTEDACAGGPASVGLAADMVASGRYDVVAVTGVITPTIQHPEGLDPTAVEPADAKYFMKNCYEGFDYAYSNPQGGIWIAQETWWPIYEYCLKYNVPFETFTKVMDKHMYNMRDNAQLNPRACMYGIPFEKEAKDAGFDSVQEYIDSTGWEPYPRRSIHAWTTTDAAACIIVCRAEDAHKYTNKAVKLGGVGHGMNGLTFGQERTPGKGRLIGFDGAMEQAYSMANLDPSTIGYMSMHDDFGEEPVTFSEKAGFIPEGEGWKYVLDGRTALDGDKPINSHGGMLSCGNSNDTDGLAEIIECMYQMRGEAGARQIKKIPEACVSITMGTGHNYAVVVLQQF